VGCLEPQVNGPRANAAIVVLARNKELEGVIQSVKSLERHFNRWFHYPYVFLNDGDFNETFRETVLSHVSGSVEFGKIPPEQWGFPDWVDPDVVKEGIAKQGDRAIMYGGMESYHHMCRFYSGYVIQHSLFWLLLTSTANSTSMSYSPSMSGTGVSSPKSNSSAISHTIHLST
jgi:mannosyltransferase